MVCLGYEKGVPSPAHGAKRPLFGQVFSDTLKSVEVLHLWPLDFAMSTVAAPTVDPLATLWRPHLSGVLQIHFGVSGLERVSIAGERRWVTQRWLCQPMSFADAKRQHDEVQAQTWRWV
jgi:hypothetical protein